MVKTEEYAKQLNEDAEKTKQVANDLADELVGEIHSKLDKIELDKEDCRVFIRCSIGSQAGLGQALGRIIARHAIQTGYDFDSAIQKVMLMIQAGYLQGVKECKHKEKLAD